MNFFLTITAEILSAAANILIAFVLIYIVDGLTKFDTEMLLDGLILAGVFIFILVLSLVSKRIFENRFIMTGLANYKNSIFERVLNKDIGELGNTASGKFINAFTNDFASIEQNYLTGTVRIISQILLLAAAVVAMATINLLMMGL